MALLMIFWYTLSIFPSISLLWCLSRIFWATSQAALMSILFDNCIFGSNLENRPGTFSSNNSTHLFQVVEDHCWISVGSSVKPILCKCKHMATARRSERD